MSNITVAQNRAELATLPADFLGTKLADHAKDGLFQGQTAGPGRSDIESDFEYKLAARYASADTPRLSGVQIKFPMHLAADGTALPSVGLPFTHILKPAGTRPRTPREAQGQHRARCTSTSRPFLRA